MGRAPLCADAKRVNGMEKKGESSGMPLLLAPGNCMCCMTLWSMSSSSSLSSMRPPEERFAGAVVAAHCCHISNCPCDCGCCCCCTSEGDLDRDGMVKGEVFMMIAS